MDGRTSNVFTSDGFPVPISASREDFNQRVIDRDRACVMTGSTGFGAFHIIPHEKGDSVCSRYVLPPSFHPRPSTS